MNKTAQTYEPGPDDRAIECIPLIDGLCMAGVNHRSAPLELREKVAVPDGQAQHVMRTLARDLGLDEVLVLSTCNRTEVYWASQEEIEPRRVFQAMPYLEQKDVQKLEPVIYACRAEEAAAHLFSVACGLDSMVLGESQIVAQVKGAYQDSRACGCAGPSLNALFQKSLEVTKKVRTHTSLLSHKASVPSVALGLTKAIFEDLSATYILVIGTGEIARITIESLKKRGAVNLGFVSRSEQRAKDWARKVRSEDAWTMDNLTEALGKADIVVACTSAEEPVITVEMTKRALADRDRPNRPLLILDLGLPRNAEKKVGKIEQVYLYNIDDLQEVVEKNGEKLEAEIKRARHIIDKAVEDYFLECRAATAASTIREIREFARQVAEAELARATNKMTGLNEKDRREMEKMVHRIMGKILHHPSQSLRLASKNGQGDQAISWARKLFGLSRDKD